MLSWILLQGCLHPSPPTAPTPQVDLAPRGDVVDTMHGTPVADPYRWMEDATTEDVQAWTTAQNQRYVEHTDALTQRPWLYDRFQALWRYDEVGPPRPCLLAEREISWSKQKEQDKWVVRMRDNPDAPWRVLIDPNTWAPTDTLAFFVPSPDCQLAAIGRANAGDENPILSVMDLDSGDMLEDTARGWRQGGVSWLHDSSGFYYSAKPLAEEVEQEGDHHYWHQTWRHQVGTTAEQDERVFWDDDVRETWHSVWQSEDGQWTLRSRGLFNQNQVWVAGADGDFVAMTDHMDIEYDVTVIEGKAFVLTDWNAPNYRVMVVDAAQPQQENWTELIPESTDRLSSISFVNGHLYANYQHRAASRIAVHNLQGEHLHDVSLPAVGSAWISGQWAHPRVRVSFSSFAHPTSFYTHDAAENTLTLEQASSMDVNTEHITVEQVHYPSKDGTEVSMFIIRNQNTEGPVPTLLKGYGGFNISMTPRFSTQTLVWLEAGGAVAIPNLRGGGEYGRAWHEAGMREQKQNVFDDFIAAAEWLRAQGVASQLAISGGSNGGLLVSAAVTQQPDLFDAVLCQVPLTDMVRFHRFGIANIWTEEYGSAEDPEMFPYIHAYSPYHNTESGVDYPAILVTGSANDARTDPVHARKFMAAVQWADADHGQEEPIFLFIQQDSGHGGAVVVDQQADQKARHLGFLMEQVGLQAP